MKDFKELKVSAKAHEMTIGVYGATRCFPKEELYGLTSQLRRSAASIGANMLARDLHLIQEDGFHTLDKQVTEVQRMLTALVQRVQPVKSPKRQSLFTIGLPEASS